jgi:hypothetical protein
MSHHLPNVAPINPLSCQGRRKAAKTVVKLAQAAAMVRKAGGGSARKAQLHMTNANRIRLIESNAKSLREATV